ARSRGHSLARLRPRRRDRCRRGDRQPAGAVQDPALDVGGAAAHRRARPVWAADRPGRRQPAQHEQPDGVHHRAQSARERSRPLRGRGERHRGHRLEEPLIVHLPTELVAIVAVALVFDYTNGFHDAANSIATVVSTRVLSPRIAVVWAAFFNFVAFAVFGVHVAKTIAKGTVDPAIVTPAIVLAALLGALIWNL